VTAPAAVRAGLDQLVAGVDARLRARRAHDARRLLAAASRALRDAGWAADPRIPAAHRHSRRCPASGNAVEWDVDGAVCELGVTRYVYGVMEPAHAPVASVQQAVDILAALTGVGVELTTAAKPAAAWMDYAATLQVELGYQRTTVQGARGLVEDLEAEVERLTRQAELREQLIADLETLVSTDQLTGVHSRRWAIEAISEPAGCVILLDLDGFKAVNDTYGHGFGDQVLVEVARRLDGIMPGQVARLGGDEFVIVLAGWHPIGEPEQIAEAAALAVGGRPIDVDSVEIDITASIGVAAVPIDGSPEDALRRADIAMYLHKSGLHLEDGPVSWAPEMTAPIAPPPTRRAHRDAEVAA
jgi:diguanylate cyclase (GGDEF)-like protein